MKEKIWGKRQNLDRQWCEWCWVGKMVSQLRGVTGKNGETWHGCIVKACQGWYGSRDFLYRTWPYRTWQKGRYLPGKLGVLSHDDWANNSIGALFCHKLALDKWIYMDLRWSRWLWWWWWWWIYDPYIISTCSLLHSSGPQTTKIGKNIHDLQSFIHNWLVLSTIFNPSEK